MWTVNVYSEAIKKLAKIQPEERERILRAIYRLRDNPFGKDVVPLRDRPGWRLRVGRWRVLMTIDKEAKVINVLAIGPRGDVYK
ncbi:MAG: type II toxin-antitoxin system RelE/ParE family toxin [Thermodesulfobacteriota bacterium]